MERGWRYEEKNDEDADEPIFLATTRTRTLYITRLFIIKYTFICVLQAVQKA